MRKLVEVPKKEVEVDEKIAERRAKDRRKPA
jgi:hypothetical protein